MNQIFYFRINFLCTTWYNVLYNMLKCVERRRSFAQNRTIRKFLPRDNSARPVRTPEPFPHFFFWNQDRLIVQSWEERKKAIRFQKIHYDTIFFVQSSVRKNSVLLRSLKKPRININHSFLKVTNIGLKWRSKILD